MVYVHERIRWINHLFMIMGIREAYVIHPYMDNLILDGNKIQ